jgi:uncharacterized protein (UPF0210 family)
MKIRSITYFVDPHWPFDNAAFASAAEFSQTARQLFEEAGYEVQTTRLATVPFPELSNSTIPGLMIELAQAMETSACKAGFDYVSIGPALPHYPESYSVIPDMLAATQNLFLSAVMASRQDGVSLPAVQACAEVIQRSAFISQDGFANLRFTALANVLPGAPFFPAAYHLGERPAFAIATEAGDLAVEACSEATSLNECRQRLTETIQNIAVSLGTPARVLEQRFGLRYGGIDFSLAPFPEQARSIGTALEKLGAPAVGKHGSLAAVAILADTLDQAGFQRTGFSGVMLPVLEDSILAARAAENILTVKDLLLYSAVCGTGLDTLPLPGNVSRAELAAILLDLAALALRLDKPLTARLMPVPGKVAGDATGFDFAYFANSRVMSLDAAPLTGFLAGEESFFLSRREN